MNKFARIGKSILRRNMKSSDRGQLFRAGRPDGEVGALDAIDGHGMSAEFVVEVEMAAFVEQVEIVLGEQGWPRWPREEVLTLRSAAWHLQTDWRHDGGRSHPERA